jgi:hypothetical protein
MPAAQLHRRLREHSSEVEATRGKQRREVDLRAEIVGDWHREVVDANPRGERFPVLYLHVLSRGYALPVAWVIIRR